MSESLDSQNRPQKPLAIFALALSLVFFFVGYYRLGHPTEFVWDEKAYVPAAQEMVSSGFIRETTHPPLGKFLIALSIWLVGDEPSHFRLPGLIAGSAAIFLVFLIGKALSQSPLVGLLASLAAATDTLSFVQARTAIFSSIMLAFMLLSLYAIIRWCQSMQRWWLLLSAVACGAACATRWVGLSILVPMLLCPVFLTPTSIPWRRAIGAAALFVTAALVTYAGLFLIGPVSRGESITELFSLHASMFNRHWSNLLVPHRYTSPWWSWPLMLRPVWYGFETYPQLGPDGHEIIEGILCLGNPLLFLSIPVLVAVGLWRAWRQRSHYQLIVLGGAFSQWLQWSWVPSNTYFHYFYTVIPFLALSIGETLARFLSGATWRWVLVALFYGGLLACFVYWYPLLTGALMTQTNAMERVLLTRWW